jgi:hypothetical protein
VAEQGLPLDVPTLAPPTDAERAQMIGFQAKTGQIRIFLWKT